MATKKKKPIVKPNPKPKSVGRPVEWTDDQIRDLGIEYLKYVKDHPHCITQGEFFGEYKLQMNRLFHKDLIGYLRTRSAEFDRLIETINYIFETRMVQQGVFSSANGVTSSYMKFILCNHYGYSEKSETKLITEKDLEITFGSEEENKDKSQS